MQKVGDGLNVGDVIDQPQNFGQAGAMAVEEYRKAKEIVQGILRSQNLDSEVLLGDWKEENVLVDFSTPSSSFPFTLWIIDQ